MEASKASAARSLYMVYCFRLWFYEYLEVARRDEEEREVAKMLRPVVLTGPTKQGSWRMQRIPGKRAVQA